MALTGRLIVIVFVVNCGSSSIKYQLINMEGERVMAKGLIERIGMEGSTLKHTPAGKYTIDLKEEIPDHKVGIRLAIKALTSKEYGVIKDMSEIDAVGHRVVHGGERFTDSVLITSDVLRGIEACCEIAPLHNPPNLYGINACMEIMRGTPQVAVFDTAFHQTMPQVAYLYGLPYEMYVKYGVRRYGFHGTSHKYVALRAAELMQEHMNDLRIISCHLGNGASIAAIKYGKSIDTSMGYTPLEGLIMGTRSGEIDPAIIPFLMEKENMNAQQIDDYLNRRSGILGISGLSSDFRDLESAANRGDAIVFTAGLGENSPFMRDKICNGLEYLGTRIDPDLNQVRGKEREISVRRARVKIFVIPTNEELVIARDTYNICRRIIKL